MICAGNTVARALALVAVATGAAFVHWGLKPLTLTLNQPGAGTSAPEPAGTGVAPSLDEPEVGPESTPGQAPAAGGGEDAPPIDEPETDAFDPGTLGTEIGTADAHRLWQLGTVAFIDARPASDYEAGHIPYSYLVPAESIGKGRLGDMMEIAGVDPSWRVVVYCEGGTCDASHLVALTLQDMGFGKIHIDVEGFPSWQAAGHEVETGPDQVLGEVP